MDQRTFIVIAGAILVGVIVVFVRWRSRRQVAEWNRQYDEMRAVFERDANARPERLQVMLTDWGEEYGDQRWRWTLWDPDFDYTSSRVEGGLVPYALGNAAKRSEAAGEAVAAAKLWASAHEWEGIVTIVDQDNSEVVEAERLG